MILPRVEELINTGICAIQVHHLGLNNFEEKFCIKNAIKKSFRFAVLVCWAAKFDQKSLLIIYKYDYQMMRIIIIIIN